jgi:hypothetical protein
MEVKTFKGPIDADYLFKLKTAYARKIRKIAAPAIDDLEGEERK